MSIAFAIILLTIAAEPELVAGPMRYTEGPAVADDGSVYFTEGGPVHAVNRFDPSTGELAVVLDKTRSGGANGLVWNGGLLYVCEDRLNRVVSVFDAEMNRTVLAETYGGKRFNGPNDLVVDEVGGIYFTDPKFGNKEYELDNESVYYIAPDGTITEAIADLVRPNGVGMSPDGKTLYVGDSGAKKLMAYDISAPGQADNARLLQDFSDLGVPDGMAVTDDGVIYITIFQGYLVGVTAEGDRLTSIETGPKTSNCVLTDSDSTLYLTAQNSLYRLSLGDN